LKREIECSIREFKEEFEQETEFFDEQEDKDT